MRALLLLALVLGAVTGCADEPEPMPLVQDGVSVVESSRPCEPPPAVTGPLPAGYPEGLTFPEGTVVTYAVEQDGSQVVTGRAQTGVSEVLQHFRQVAEPAGFLVTQDEDEGASGRLRLFGGASEADVIVVRRTCPMGTTGFTVTVRRTVG